MVRGAKIGPRTPAYLFAVQLFSCHAFAMVRCLRVVAVLIPMGLVNQPAGVPPVPAGRRGAPPSVTAPDGAIARCAGFNAPAAAGDDPSGKGRASQAIGHWRIIL